MELPSSDNEGNVSQHNAEQATIVEIYSSDNGSEAEEEDMVETEDELEEMPMSNTFLGRSLMAIRTQTNVSPMPGFLCQRR